MIFRAQIFTPTSVALLLPIHYTFLQYILYISFHN